MVLLLSALAFAQEEPQEFDPVPADVEVEGHVLQGILVDEKTYTELGELRVEVQRLKADIESFEEWKASQSTILEQSLAAIREEHASSQEQLVVHYEEALKRAKKKDALQRHGFTLGVAVGVVATTVLTVAVINAYDGTLPDGITGN